MRRAPAPSRRAPSARVRTNTNPGSLRLLRGDLGVKTKANVVNPYKDLAPSGPDYLKAESNLLVSPEPNLTAGHNLAIDLSYDAEREKANNLGDLAHALAPTASTSSLPPELELKKQYHELTTDSFGVLSDAFRGGLRRDLTAYFGTLDTQWDGDGSNGENELTKSPLQGKGALSQGIRGGQRQGELLALQPQRSHQGRRGPCSPPHVERPPRLLRPARILLRFRGRPSPHATTISPLGPRPVPPTGSRPLRRLRYPTHQKRLSRQPHEALHTQPDRLRPLRPRSYNLADQREEPTNHPVGPVLVELQHRQILYTAAGGDGQVLRLAIMPTFALWNPYNVRLAEASYQMEYVVNGCTVAAYNTKEREIFYKWAIHSQRNALLQTTDSRGRVLTVNQQRNRHLDKNGNYYNFGGLDRYGWGDPHTGEPYMDINLNGRYDPRTLQRQEQ